MTTSCLQNCPSPHDRAALLRQRSVSFANAFMDGKSPEKLLKDHFTTSPKILEHGPQMKKMPFVGRLFENTEGCLEYFELLGETLDFELAADTFPDPSGFIVDAEVHMKGVANDIHLKGSVCVVGKARFRSLQTGQSWNEHFMWRLSGFDAAGMIGHWEIWADPLSAHLAIEGRLL